MWVVSPLPLHLHLTLHLPLRHSASHHSGRATSTQAKLDRGPPPLCSRPVRLVSARPPLTLTVGPSSAVCNSAGSRTASGQVRRRLARAKQPAHASPPCFIQTRAASTSYPSPPGSRPPRICLVYRHLLLVGVPGTACLSLSRSPIRAALTPICICLPARQPLRTPPVTQPCGLARLWAKYRHCPHYLTYRHRQFVTTVASISRLVTGCAA